MGILVDELELYTNYANTLDKAVGLMTYWKQKNSQFAKIIFGIEVSCQMKILLYSTFP